MASTHRVEGLACPCPGSPHEAGDWVDLRTKLGLAAGVELQGAVRDRIGQADGAIAGALVEGYLRHGVIAWSFVDGIGAEIPVTPETIQSILNDDFTLATPIAEAADLLYQAAVLGPLVAAAQTSSPTTPTEQSTSPTTTGLEPSRTRSSPSSTEIIPTAGIETTSSPPDGDSKWSQIEPMAQLLDAS